MATVAIQLDPETRAFVREEVKTYAEAHIGDVGRCFRECQDSVLAQLELIGVAADILEGVGWEETDEEAAAFSVPADKFRDFLGYERKSYRSMLGDAFAWQRRCEGGDAKSYVFDGGQTESIAEAARQVEEFHEGLAQIEIAWEALSAATYPAEVTA